MAPIRQTKLTFAPSSSLNPRSSPSKASLTSSTKAKVSIERVQTDVILCIKPKFVELICSGEKNHEYRKYKLKDSVKRLWFYETAPTSAITYVMETGRPKVPGEVCDPSGVGNDDFDAGKKVSKYGYPVLGLRKLKQPLSIPAIKTKYGFSPPQGWMYAPTALVEGELFEEMEVVV